MREIKFRGKRLDNGEWVIGSLLQSEIDVNKLNVKCQVHTRFADDFSIRAFDVDPKTVGEFTGLKDKNGKEIYEGYIMQRDSYWAGEKIGEEIATVIFKNCQFILVWQKDKAETSLFNLLKGFFIIGNIYENPDLIK